MDILGQRDLLDMAGLNAEDSNDRKRLAEWLNRNHVPYVRIGRAVRGRSSGVLIDAEALVKAMRAKAKDRAGKPKRTRRTKVEAAKDAS